MNIHVIAGYFFTNFLTEQFKENHNILKSLYFYQISLRLNFPHGVLQFL